MKKDVHPTWYPDAQVICSCGATFTIGATQEMIRTDVCSNCHPFFTGEQRIVDSEGQVDRFMRRLERREEMLDLEQKRRTKKARRQRRRAVAEIVDEASEAEAVEEEPAAGVAS